MMRRFLLPVASVPLIAVQCDAPKPPVNDSSDAKSRLCKPSELPLYVPKRASDLSEPNPANSDNLSSVETAVGTVRKELSGALGMVSTSVNQLLDKASDADKNYTEIRDFLRAEENSMPRYGAIAVGGLTGYIYGAIRGRFRKYLYTTVGALGMASLCYPKEAAQYSQVVFNDSRKYLTVAYNFVLGVKPGEEVSLPELPSIPTSLDDVKSMVSGLGESVKNLVNQTNDKPKD